MASKSNLASVHSCNSHFGKYPEKVVPGRSTKEQVINLLKGDEFEDVEWVDAENDGIFCTKAGFFGFWRDEKGDPVYGRIRIKGLF